MPWPRHPHDHRGAFQGMGFRSVSSASARRPQTHRCYYQIGIEPKIPIFSKKMVRHKSALPPPTSFARRIKAPRVCHVGPWPWPAAARGEVFGIPSCHVFMSGAVPIGLALHTRSSAPCLPLRPRPMHEARIAPRRAPLPCAVCVLIAFWSPSPPGSGSVLCLPRAGCGALIFIARSGHRAMH